MLNGETVRLTDWPPELPDTDFFCALRAAHDAEADPTLRAYLASLANLATISDQMARYEFARYQTEKEASVQDWHWRWRAEVAAWGDNPQAAFYARWLLTSQTFSDPESARRLAALRRCAETTPAWAARELDAFWGVPEQA